MSHRTQKSTRRFAWCYKKLFLGKSLDTIAKQVYCYRINVLVSFYIHLFFFLVILLLKLSHVVTLFALNFVCSESLIYIPLVKSSLLSVTLVENSRIEKKTNIIEKEVLVKSQTEVESKKLAWRCFTSYKTMSGFLWARLFLRLTFSAFKLLHILLSSWKVRIFVVLQIAFSQTRSLNNFVSKIFYLFWSLNVAIILWAINVSKTRFGYGREASDFAHLKHWECTMYYPNKNVLNIFL